MVLSKIIFYLFTPDGCVSNPWLMRLFWAQIRIKLYSDAFPPTNYALGVADGTVGASMLTNIVVPYP